MVEYPYIAQRRVQMVRQTRSILLGEENKWGSTVLVLLGILRTFGAEVDDVLQLRLGATIANTVTAKVVWLVLCR